MTYYIGCDAHKKYSVFVSMNEHGQCDAPVRVEHAREELRTFLAALPRGSPIAVETIGNWYWLVDEMERAGHHPKLAQAREAKRLMGKANKTDKLDAKGLATLLRNGRLPEVWIPPSALRDQRELPRLRLTLGHTRTQLKNRIHAAFAKYGITFPGVSDLFGGKGRQLLEQRLPELPGETQRSVRTELELLDQLAEHLTTVEERIRQVVRETPAMQRLKTLPGVGDILAIVLALELGDVKRFPSAEHLASYAGTVPRLHESGGRSWHGQVRTDVNRDVKWALVAAATIVVLNQENWQDKHVVVRYQRLRKHKGHAKAVVAVARHLAESTYWVLKKDEDYREPRH